MERRGRIPVAKFRTQEGKTRSRSRVREPDYNEQDPETDLFTLLEDNIALKEENKALKLEIEDHKKLQNELLEDNTKMREELDSVISQQNKLEEEIGELAESLAKTNSERIALDKLHKIEVKKNETLTLELHQKRTPNPSTEAMLDCVALQSKLLKILPDLGANETESLLDVETTAAMPVNSELVERLVDEFLALKNLMSSVELQLYEANEKISELLENQHHMEEESETIRTENANLTRVAKLLTENMKESVETSKKMEAALIKLKQRNEELMAKSRGDSIDGLPDSRPSPTTLRANADFEAIQKEAHNQNLDHGERIVEMKNLMEAAIQKNTNDELIKMQVKMEILEEELRQALARASKAENELQTYKNRNSSESVQQQIGSVSIQASPPPPPPPPPSPPPLPATLLYKPTSLNILKKRRIHEGSITENSDDDATARTAFSGNMLSTQENLRNRSNSSGGGDKIIGSVMQQVHAEAATGVDALVRELKSGRVTLRRNRRKTRTNEALQEMFQVLEISQKQNRNSKICIDLHI